MSLKCKLHPSGQDKAGINRTEPTLLMNRPVAMRAAQMDSRLNTDTHTHTVQQIWRSKSENSRRDKALCTKDQLLVLSSIRPTILNHKCIIMWEILTLNFNMSTLNGDKILMIYYEMLCTPRAWIRQGTWRWTWCLSTPP